MINVQAKKENGHYKSFHINGHSMYAEAGSNWNADRSSSTTGKEPISISPVKNSSRWRKKQLPAVWNCSSWTMAGSENEMMITAVLETGR